MSFYRKSAPIHPPAVITVKRSILIAVVLFSFVGIGFFIGVGIFSRAELTCSRERNHCDLVVTRGPDIFRSKRSFALPSLRKAFVDSYIDEEGTRLSGIALDVDGKTMIVDGHSNVYNDTKEEWAREVNQYLTSGAADELDISYGSTWPAYILTGIGLVIVAAWVMARTRFIVDYGNGRFRIEERGFGTTYTDIELEQIEGALIHEKVDDEGTKLEGVVLKLRDGTLKELTMFSNTERGEKERLLVELDEALEKVHAQGEM